jgi:Cof subfamily protein (haloacid dehalogenase superfamily)
LYKAVFIDVDGTLIRSDHSLSVATTEAIEKLQEKGILVILVSARPLSGIRPIAEELHLGANPIASLNGAYIAQDEKIIFDSTISADITVSVHEVLQKFNATVIYYQQDEWFSETKTFYTDYEQRITEVPVKIQSFDVTVNQWRKNNTGPNKMLVIAGKEMVVEIQHHLQQQFVSKLNVYTSKPTYLEIMNIDASKVNAVKFLTALYNIKQQEIIAIGDNYNDKEMIEFAEMGIAMGNAPDPVKAAANYITKTNNEDGVSLALSHFFCF